MKKFLLLLLVIFMAFGCSNVNDGKEHYDVELSGKGYVSGTNTSIRKFEFEGHEYLMFMSDVYCVYSVSVIHSESCPCKHKDY